MALAILTDITNADAKPVIEIKYQKKLPKAIGILVNGTIKMAKGGG